MYDAIYMKYKNRQNNFSMMIKDNSGCCSGEWGIGEAKRELTGKEHRRVF